MLLVHRPAWLTPRFVNTSSAWAAWDHAAADDSRKEQALTALKVITEDGSNDEWIAERLGSQEAATEAMGLLAGFLLEALAISRAETPHQTTAFVRFLIQGDDGDGLAGVPARI